MSKDKEVNPEFKIKKEDNGLPVREVFMGSALLLAYKIWFDHLEKMSSSRFNPNNYYGSGERLSGIWRDLSYRSVYQLESEFFKDKQHTNFLYRNPEKIPYILSLSQEERSVFMADAIKEKNPHEILLRDTFESNVLLEFRGNNILEDILKEKIAGPWSVDPKSHKLMKDLGRNIHFDTLLRCLAIDNLNSRGKQRLTLFTPLNDVGGYANYLGNVVVDTKAPESSMLGILAHEFSHRGIWLSNLYLHAKPYAYNDLVGGEVFEGVMKKTLENLHQQFMPDISLPLGSIELARSLDNYCKENIILKQEKEIINVLARDMLLNDFYSESQHHSEFVVKMHEIIGLLGELPPYIRDAFSPLENYYKTEITPKWLNYINSYSEKDMLLAGEMGKYYPETIFNFSGEDELLRKDTENLRGEEKELVSQIKNMKRFIEEGDINAVREYLFECKDERVVRESLRICIEQDSQIFDDVLSHIQAPQYLGPQLVLAANLGRREMFTKLLPKITNDYYLTRALEVALDNNDQDLVQASIVGIKDVWFLNRSANKYPNNSIVNNAIKDLLLEENINKLRDRYKDKSGVILKISKEPFARDYSVDLLNHLVELNSDSLNKYLKLLEKREVVDWINNGNTVMKLRYLTGLNQDQLSLTLKVLEESKFNDWNDGTGRYDNLRYITTLDKDRRNMLFNVLSGFEDIDYHNNLKILRGFNSEQQNITLDIVKNLNTEDVGKLLYALKRINDVGEGELNKVLKILEVPEFKAFVCHDPDQNDIVKDKSNGFFFDFDDKFNSPNLQKKLNCLMGLNPEQINVFLVGLKEIDYNQQGLFLSTHGNNGAMDNVGRDLTKLLNLHNLPKDELKNLLAKDLKETSIAYASENIMLPNVPSESAFSGNRMISSADGDIGRTQANNLGATSSILPQLALAATTARMAQGMHGYFVDLLSGSNKANSKIVKHKTMESKLSSLSSKFKELHDKLEGEYRGVNSEAHAKEVSHLKDLHKRARDTLNRLNKFNKRSKSEGEEVLLHDAKEIFTDYKKLKKELKEVKQLQDAKSLVQASGLAGKLKKYNVAIDNKRSSFVDNVKSIAKDGSRGI